MTHKVNYDKSRRDDGVHHRPVRILEPLKAVRLDCGHAAQLVAVVVYADGKRRLYRCPKGCGLQLGQPKRSL